MRKEESDASSPSALLFDFSKHVNGYLSENIRAADTKSNIILTISLGFIAVLTTDFTAKRQLYFSNLIKISLFCLAVTAFVWSIFWTVASLWPRLFRRREGYIFWGNIRQWGSVEAFTTGMISLNDGQIIEEIISHNHSLADIASKKYSYIRLAMPGFLLGSAVGVLASLL